MKKGHGLHVILLGVVTFVVGCSSNSEPKVIADPSPAKLEGTPAKINDVPSPSGATGEPAPPKPAPPARVSNRPANPDGQVFIVEYHHVAEGKGDMFRSPADFRKDLERLHKLGFRPCTVSDYLKGEFPIPPGASPAVFTFDDSNPSQLQLLPDGTVDPTCAVGIWQAFAAEHPDFPVRATFYVLPDVMFGQPKMRTAKLELLSKLGCELGSHTMSHPILKRLSEDKVKEELSGAIDRLEAMGESSPVSIALPFGISPRNAELLRGFERKGKRYEMKAALLVGANPAPSPTNPKLNRYRIPRIQAYPGPYGLDYWLKELDKGNVKLYIQS